MNIGKIAIVAFVILNDKHGYFFHIIMVGLDTIHYKKKKNGNSNALISKGNSPPSKKEKEKETVLFHPQKNFGKIMGCLVYVFKQQFSIFK